MGLIVVTLLYVNEVANYRHDLRGTREYYVTRDFDNHPGCTLRQGNPRELTCPMRAFNSIQLHCLTDQCVYRDPDAADVTPEVVESYRQRMMSEFGKMPAREATYDETPQ